VNFGVCGILELLRHVVVWIGGSQLGRSFHRSVHPFGRGSQNHIRTESLEQPAAFDRHAFGHAHLQLVSSSCTDIRESDSGIAATRLNDDSVRLNQTVSFGGVDHSPANPILHAPKRIHVFDFGNDISDTAFDGSLQSHQRRVANAMCDFLVNPHSFS
jgi:hypothetical protein